LLLPLSTTDDNLFPAVEIRTHTTVKREKAVELLFLCF
jgi:hypothetical protein